ncbi:MAG: amino acid permease [Methanoculleus sp.]|nr:amino acid permease [Methanoculleus sp.]
MPRPLSAAGVSDGPLPAGQSPLHRGWGGVVTGAAIVFFAYIGFDAVSTTAEEVRNPRRDLPVGLIGSLLIATALYIAVSLVLTGIVPYPELNVPAPVAFALDWIGIPWGGALLGITSVLLVLLFGQTQIIFAMSRDGLLPAAFGEVHPTLRTPVNVTLVVGLVTAAIGSLLPLGAVAELVNIGTLAAFIIVSAGVIVIRHTRPDARRPFRVPFVPAVPLLAIFSCVYLIVALPTVTHLRFVVWLLIGLVIYFAYGSRRTGAVGEVG